MKIAFVNAPAPIGGPGTFQTLLERRLVSRGYTVQYRDDRDVPHIVIVIGGTRHITWLKHCKSKGAKIIQRLDGLNWRLRRGIEGVVHHGKGFLQNNLMNFIRMNIADHVVYQSQFCKNWWRSRYGRESSGSSVIYNGTDVRAFYPINNYIERTQAHKTLLIAEGTFETDSGTVAGLQQLTTSLISRGRIAKVVAYGKILQNRVNIFTSIDGIEYRGAVQRESMPAIYRDSAVFYSIEINAACPNAVIEAMASGAPIIGYATGSLQELVGTSAGVLADYGIDPWGGGVPNVKGLLEAAEEVLDNRRIFAEAARERAVTRFSDIVMTNEYEILFEKLSAH